MEKNEVKETMNYLMEKYVETNDEKYLEKIMQEQTLIQYILKTNGIVNDPRNKEKFVLGIYTYEDIMSLAYFSLFKTIKTYDKNLGYNMVTLFSTILRNDINILRRKNKLDKPTVKVSMNDSFFNNPDDDDEISYAERIKDETINFEEELPDYITLQEAINKANLTKLESLILQAFLSEKTQIQLAKELAISQSYISRKKESAIQKIKKYIK